MENDPSKIQELEKYLPFMTADERNAFFLFSVDQKPISFTSEQLAKRESILNERNGKIQNKFNKAIKK